MKKKKKKKKKKWWEQRRTRTKKIKKAEGHAGHGVLSVPVVADPCGRVDSPQAHRTQTPRGANDPSNQRHFSGGAQTQHDIMTVGRGS